MAQERLQKLIARTGLLSRRGAEAAITEGRVSLNGEVVTELGTKADAQKDEISLDGKKIPIPKVRIVLALHKPPGTITTKDDPQERPTVIQLIEETGTSTNDLKPIGRLDQDTTGLLLLTNDGDLANQIMHPSHGIKKTYQAWVRGRVQAADLAPTLEPGIELEDGMGKFEKIDILAYRNQMRETRLEVMVSEGRKRFVRRMLEEIGHPVLDLHRSAIGGLLLSHLRLKQGQSRALQENELEKVFR